jgi:hypothetical protein
MRARFSSGSGQPPSPRYQLAAAEQRISVHALAQLSQAESR